MWAVIALERSVDITARSLALTDTFQPLTDMQVSRIITLPFTYVYSKPRLAKYNL